MRVLFSTPQAMCLRLKVLRFLAALPGDNMDKVISENKGNTLSLYTKLALEVAQKMSEVNMNKLE